MINVPKPISPKVTDLESQISRVRMRGNSHSKKIQELRAKKSDGQNNINDRDARIAIALAGEDFPAASDIDAQITAEMLNWEATSEAEQSLKPRLAAAKFEASTAVLASVKKPHDEAVSRLVTALAEGVAPAYVEIFQLSRELKDKEIGWRNGVCELVPQLVDLFGGPNQHSPIGQFLQAAVAAGYLKAGQLPRELR